VTLTCWLVESISLADSLLDFAVVHSRTGPAKGQKVSGLWSGGTMSLRELSGAAWAPSPALKSNQK